MNIIEDMTLMWDHNDDDKIIYKESKTNEKWST